MDALLNKRLPHEALCLEIIFKEVVTPWFQAVGKKGAAIYTRASQELARLKGKKKTKVGKQVTKGTYRFFFSVWFSHIQCRYTHFADTCIRHYNIIKNNAVY